LQIIYEDNHLIGVNKSASELVQGDKTGDSPLSDLLKEYIRKKYSKPGEVFLGVIHRLDRPVTGVVVFARTSKSLERMNRLFSERETKKTYLALVKEHPAQQQGTLRHYLVKDEAANKTTAHRNEVKGSQYAELEYRVLAEQSGFFMLEVQPLTGRPHQIRVQLASMDCPIVGDLKYGYPEPNSDRSICLHSRKLEFIHPVKKEPLILQADLPDFKWWKHFKKSLNG
jgi:23S rRNA pseudouridine1911/1915/1917 synthase